MIVGSWLCFGSCLSIDTITSVKTKEGWKGYQVLGHNSCKTKQPVKDGMYWSVDVGLYDKDGARIGLDSFVVMSLETGEKLKHVFPIPYGVEVNGETVVIKVRGITERSGLTVGN